MDTLQNEWPPIRLGILPDAESADLLDISGLSRLGSRKLSYTSQVDKIIGKNLQYDNLLKIWSVRPIMDEDRESYYLSLAEQTIAGEMSTWKNYSHCDYPSNKIYIPESYQKAASIFL
jgi:hypothetical protein